MRHFKNTKLQNQHHPKEGKTEPRKQVKQNLLIHASHLSSKQQRSCGDFSQRRRLGSVLGFNRLVVSNDEAQESLDDRKFEKGKFGTVVRSASSMTQKH
jgi:hypothetical protein